MLLAGSLPGLFRRAREDFARQPAKLLSALPERVAHYRQRLAVPGQRLNVALSWRSTREDWFVQKKSVPLVDFSPLLKLPGVRFVDVQYGDTAAERSATEVSTGVQVLRFDDVDHFNDLEEVLAILEACDLLDYDQQRDGALRGRAGQAHLAALSGKSTRPFTTGPAMETIAALGSGGRVSHWRLAR